MTLTGVPLPPQDDQAWYPWVEALDGTVRALEAAPDPTVTFGDGAGEVTEGNDARIPTPTEKTALGNVPDDTTAELNTKLTVVAHNGTSWPARPAGGATIRVAWLDIDGTNGVPPEKIASHDFSLTGD